MDRYSKNGYNVLEYNFRSLHDFTKYISETPVSRHFRLRDHKSMEEDAKVPIDYDRAIYYCNNGCNVNFTNLLCLKKKIDTTLLFPSIKTEVKRDIVGICPSVPDYLTGNPMSMWNVKNSPEYRCIEICVNLACDYQTTQEQLFARGIFVQSLIDTLQYKGYGVSLNAFHASTFRDEMLIAYFGLKNANERLNVRKTYFPLCDLAFMRRLIFRLIEVAPLKYSWAYNYGVPANRRLIESFVQMPEKRLIIPEPDEIGIMGKDINKDLDVFLKYIQFDKFVEKVK